MGSVLVHIRLSEVGISLMTKKVGMVSWTPFSTVVQSERSKRFLHVTVY